MILNSNILNKILNSDLVKKIYPMIDHIETIVIWDKDEELPSYKIHITIFVNDPEMTTFNMFERGMDPHYLVDEYMMYLIKHIGSGRREIDQVYVSVVGPNDNRIWG